MPYRPRWRKLALAGGLALVALVAVTWIVLWVRPPAPARIVILSASYDRTTAVPPNPYGKHDARELASLTRPGSWFGTRSRLTGGPTSPLTRIGLPDLSTVREKCVVVFIAAHGGRDRDGPFLFPEDTSGDPSERVRFKTILDRLARLPADKQKLLIIDATHAPAFADLGLVHNDFAAAVEELDAAGDIAKVPNLVIFLSSGADERSWCSPEWGKSAFTHFTMTGLNGSADADGNKRVTASELIAFVTPKVFEWARDNRGARQMPVLLPKTDGIQRTSRMHLVSVDGKPSAPVAPTPFDPPAELEQLWSEYRALATATPPPTAYTPHLWRQYEAWVLRYEELILANDTEGAKIARANADELRRKIESARTLDISPQTLALQSAVGGQKFVNELPNGFVTDIGTLAGKSPADRGKTWIALRDAKANVPSANLLWVRALIEWTAVDPLNRLPIARDLVPLVEEGFSIRPAELHFLAMLAKHLPPQSKAEVIGPLLTQVLRQRVWVEELASGVAPNPHGEFSEYPFAEFLYAWNPKALADVDALRRASEDLCFATNEASWQDAKKWVKTRDESSGKVAQQQLHRARLLVSEWHRQAHVLPGIGEWTARRLIHPADDAFFRRAGQWSDGYTSAALIRGAPASDEVLTSPNVNRDRSGELQKAELTLSEETATLLKAKPEFDAGPTPRAEAVKWWNHADAVFTAAPPKNFDPAQRVALAREFRRVSRQLLITGETHPEPLPEVTAAKTREIAFQTAERRGRWMLGRLGAPLHMGALIEVRPGEDSTALSKRLTWFAFQADGRQSLAEFGSRCGELFAAATTLAKRMNNPTLADVWIRISPAHAAITDEPIDRLRRERVRAYLAYQAKRTFEDHWYGEGTTPYYRIAVQKLSGDATGVVSAFDLAGDPFAPYLAVPPFPVEPELPERIAITDEPNPAVNVKFKPKGKLGLSGVPVFWTDPATRTPPSSAVEEIRLTRPPLPQPLTPKAQTQPFQINGFFRGQFIARSCPVDFYAIPDRTAVTAPLPQDVGLALRADPNSRKLYGFGTGAVAIVLDCSGSMARNQNDPKSVGRYPLALEAFATLLNELPAGTHLTVFTFGARTTSAKTPEDTIQEVMTLTKLPLDRAKILEEVLNRVRTLQPYHESPIVRAVVKAKNSIANAKVPFKAVVLISDAVDTRFAQDPEFADKKRSISETLRAEFEPAKVALGVASFKVDIKEEQAIQAEFKIVEKLTPTGLFVSHTDVKQLADWLLSGLNPRVRFALDPLTSDTPPPGELLAGSAETDNWYAGKLSSGDYRVRIVDGPAFASDIRLSPGDFLLLELTENEKKFSLKRHWYAHTVPAIAKAGESQDPWRLALLQNWSKDNRLELFAAIDGDPDKVNPLTPTRIADVWFDSTPSVPQPEPVAIRWRAEGGYPCPSWVIDSPGWPNFPGSSSAASPKLSAWWSAEPFPAADVKFVASPKSGVVGTSGCELITGGVAIKIESVTLEEHEVDIAPGDRRKQLCLVVRLSHPKDNPVFARPTGVAPTAREWRVYKSANRTTSLFWWSGLNEASVKAKVTGFEFVVLNDALNVAKKASQHLTLPAPTPTSNSERPKPLTK